MPSREPFRAGVGRSLTAHPAIRVLREGLVTLRDSFIPTRPQQVGALLVLTLFLIGLVVMLFRR